MFLAVRPAAAQEGPIVVGYDFDGELLDPRTSLHPIFGTVIKIGEPWDTEKKKSVEALAARLAYRASVRTTTSPTGVAVTIELHPADRVRHVRVYDIWPVFGEEEIKSRLELRPGGALAPEGPEREKQLREEEQHVLDYLRRLAYFDGTVTINAVREAKHEYALNVTVTHRLRYTIGKVAVEGNTAIETKDILDHITRAVWWQIGLAWVRLYQIGFSKEQLDKDLEEIARMYQERGYPRAQVTSTYNPSVSIDRLAKTVNFKILIDEGKKIDSVFEGLERLSEAHVKQALTFNAERAYDDYEVEQSKAAIRDLYQKQGFFQALVAAERVRLTPEFERIIFTIDEGPRLVVASIRFAGNKTFTTARLKGLISTREHPGRLAFVVSGGFVTTLQLQQDVEAIRDYYHAQGFPSATVEARVAMDARLLDDMGALAGAITSEEPGDLHIRFTVDEGPRDVVAVRDFVGNKTPVTDARLAAITKLAPGVPFTEARMNADAEAIVRLYAERGHARATVQPEYERIGEKVSIRFLIDEGEPVRLGKILIRGNFHTSTWVVREILGLKEGDRLTTGRVDQAQVQLRTTDLFTSVYPEYIGFKDASGPVHLLVDVEERHDNHGVFEFAVGYSTDNGPFFGSRYQLRNMFGVGVTLDADLELAIGDYIDEGCPQICRFNVGFGVPLWVMRRVGVPFKLDTQFKYREDNSEPRFGSLQTNGVSVALSRVLRPGIYLSLKFDYNLFNRPEDLIRPAGASEVDDTTQIQTRTLSIGPALVIDRRKDALGIPSPLSPSEGYLLSGSAALAPPILGSDFFVKFNFSAQYFRKIGGRVVVSNALRYDQGVPLGDSALLPEVERFAAGGDTTVRGFEEDRLHTEIVRDPLAPAGLDQFKVIPAGGNIRFIHNLDVQVRVVDGFIGSLPLASAIFVDTGLVTNSLDGFRLDKLRHSLGIAFARLMTPFGNLSFEWAIPLDPQLGDDPTGRFHFNFGFAFGG